MPCRTHRPSCAPDFEAPFAWAHSSPTRPAQPQKLVPGCTEAPKSSFNASQTRRPSQGGLSRPPRHPPVPAQTVSQHDAVFCGAYSALQCGPDCASTQSMMQLQALAVADLALRQLADSANRCTTSDSSPQPLAFARPGHWGALRAEHEQRTSVQGQELSAPHTTHADGLQALADVGETYLVAGHAGEHVEVHPSILRMWERVRCLCVALRVFRFFFLFSHAICVPTTSRSRCVQRKPLFPTQAKHLLHVLPSGACV